MYKIYIVFLQNSDLVDLLKEINANLKWNLSSADVVSICGFNAIAKCPQIKFMVENGIKLSESEFIAIKLWSASQNLTMHYHVDHANNEQDKWKLFTTALSNGIRKIHSAVVMNENTDDIENSSVFPALPQVLYRGTKEFDPSQNWWKIDSILSFTTSYDVARRFAKQANHNANRNNASYLLAIYEMKEHLLNGSFVAAPIDWLSLFKGENEWIILPSDTNFVINI